MTENYDEYVGKRVKLKVMPMSIRWPKTAHQPGGWALASFNLLEVLEGEVPEDFTITNNIIAKGNMPTLTFRDPYVIIAHLDYNQKYGYSYTVDFMRLDYQLNTITEQRKFLSYILSEHQLNLLFESCPNVMEVLENHDIAALTKIKGIGAATATRICQRYDDNIDRSVAYVELQQLGLTKNALDKLITHYGSPDTVVEKINANPYILIEEVSGYGWAKADAIAQAQGIPVNSPYRARACAIYYLQTQANDNGHSWIGMNELLNVVDQTCDPIEQSVLYDVIKSMITPQDASRPVLFYDRDTQRVGLNYIRQIEEDTAYELLRLKNSPASITIDHDIAENIIQETEETQGFTYTEEQRQAIWSILDNQVIVLTGLAGCGKTASVNAVTHVLKSYDYKIGQCSLSGRAASKLTEVTHIPGQTIHRMLGFNMDNNEFLHDKQNPLHYDIVIVDEVSMIGIELFVKLLEAIPSGCKLLLIGDPGQLEAIGLANVLNDCIKSQVLPVCKLTKIQRQQANSGIITQSIRISNGENIISNNTPAEEYRGALKDFKLVLYNEAALTQVKIMEEYRYLYYDKHISPNDIQVVVPMRARGEASCRALNIEIQALVNPQSFGPTITCDYVDGNMKYTYTYKQNDRIIITKNIYNTVDVKGRVQPVFNGNIGYIEKIENDQIIVHLSEQGSVILNSTNLEDIALGYAVTVHKKQGDSAPYIIFGIDYTAYALLSREMLYTGVTRARKYCALIGQRTAIMNAIKTSRVKVKQTWLRELLQQAVVKHTIVTEA